MQNFLKKSVEFLESKSREVPGTLNKFLTDPFKIFNMTIYSFEICSVLDNSSLRF